MYENQKLDNNGVEVCLFPMEYLTCTQGPGFLSNGQLNIGSFSHCNSWAVDMTGENASLENLFAPVTLICYKKYEAEVRNAHATLFYSKDKVLFPDGTIDYLDLLLCHDHNISDLVVGDPYIQGTPIYTEGDYGVGVQGNHIHIEARKRGDNGLPALKEYWYDAYGNRLENGDHGYTKYTWSLINNQPLQSVFFINDTTIKADIPQIANVPAWQFYNAVPFDPSNKIDGWHQYNGTWYYVENHACVTGWQKIGSSWYCFEADGKMKTGWVAYGNDWYWLSPGSGVMQINEFVDNERFYVGSDGKMLRSGWTLINGEYYYFKDKERDTAAKFSPFADGEKVTNVWIASGSSWYYMLSNGKMATNCQIKENGKYYAFNSSGACLNQAGQTTQYNTTTYPMKS